MLKGTTTVNSSLVSPPCRTSVPILTPRTISQLLRASSASKSLLFSLGKPVAQRTIIDKWLELDRATGMGVVAGDMAVVVAKKAVALIEEMEEEKVEEDEVKEEPPWPMALTLLMSQDLSLTKNGELSQARADDMSIKSAIGSVAVPTKEVQERSPQPLP
jgi:hypothetical protein